MEWNDIAIMIGAGVVLVGAIASTPPVFWRWRQPPQQTRLTTTVPIESVRELAGRAAFMAGMVLIQVGALAKDLWQGASHQWLATLLAAIALLILLCGVEIGRLSVRWQLRPEASIDREADDESGVSGPRTTC